MRPATPTMVIRPDSLTTVFRPITPTTVIRPATPTTVIRPVTPNVVIRPVTPTTVIRPAIPTTDTRPVTPTLVNKAADHTNVVNYTSSTKVELSSGPEVQSDRPTKVVEPVSEKDPTPVRLAGRKAAKYLKKHKNTLSPVAGKPSHFPSIFFNIHNSI